MKRYNIHLSKEWIEELDKIGEEATKALPNEWYYGKITRSDLIRVAIGDYYGLGRAYTHRWYGDLVKVLKKIRNNRAREKHTHETAGS